MKHAEQTPSPVLSPMEQMLPKVEAWLSAYEGKALPLQAGGPFQVTPLAQGEYNLNYRVSTGRQSVVFRVNMGTQIDRDDQIVYEYRTLKLLQESGVTPVPYLVDDTRRVFHRGILIMEYLPGEPLDYGRDTAAAADVLAAIHKVPVDGAGHHLIVEDRPLSLIVEECRGLLDIYFRSELAETGIRSYLGEVLAWAEAAKARERYYREDPWLCIVNTEVNSGNFIVNRRKGSVHLVDWEMPRWGDPSQDIAHFCSPLTTLWKTSYRMSSTDKRLFLKHYRSRMEDPHLKETLEERVRLREPFVYLRGISWSAMGWAAYQTDFDGVKNPDTWKTLQRYMDPGFIRNLFDPILERG